MDPTIAGIIAPWTQLGIAGTVVVALSFVAWKMWGHIKDITERHLADVKAYADKYADILMESSKTQTALANAIERIGDKIK